MNILHFLGFISEFSLNKTILRTKWVTPKKQKVPNEYEINNIYYFKFMYTLSHHVHTHTQTRIYNSLYCDQKSNYIYIYYISTLNTSMYLFTSWFVTNFIYISTTRSQFENFDRTQFPTEAFLYRKQTYIFVIPSDL